MNLALPKVGMDYFGSLNGHLRHTGGLGKTPRSSPDRIKGEGEFASFRQGWRSFGHRTAGTKSPGALGGP